MTVAFYSGSFDPPTLGHSDIIGRALKIFDGLVVGVGSNASKTPLFPVEDRVAMIEEQLRDLGAGEHCRVVQYAGLTIHAAGEAGATVIVRGLRDGADLAYEMQMGGMNAVMAPGIQTVFLGASPSVGHITSTLVRQIAQLGGPYDAFVSPSVAGRIAARLKRA